MAKEKTATKSKKKAAKTPKRPANMLISCPAIEAWTDDLLKTDWGFQFIAQDPLTKQPVLLSLTYGGVLIAEYDIKLSPEAFKLLCEEQKKLNDTANEITLMKMGMISTANATKAEAMAEVKKPTDMTYG